MTGAGELGYRHGMDTARDILLLRSAVLETPLNPGDMEAVERGAAAMFPVTAADLMPEYEGAALGQRLAELERRWIASGFDLDKDALLSGGDG